MNRVCTHVRSRARCQICLGFIEALFLKCIDTTNNCIGEQYSANTICQTRNLSTSRSEERRHRQHNTTQHTLKKSYAHERMTTVHNRRQRQYRLNGSASLRKVTTVHMTTRVSALSMKMCGFTSKKLPNRTIVLTGWSQASVAYNVWQKVLCCDVSERHYENSCAAALHNATLRAVFGKKANRRVHCAEADVPAFLYGLADCFRSWPVIRSIVLWALDFSRTQLLQRSNTQEKCHMFGWCLHRSNPQEIFTGTDGVCSDRILRERFMYANIIHESEIGFDADFIFCWI